MKMKELKKLTTVLLASGALAFTLSACNGDRETAQDSTPPGSPGIEQPAETPSAEAPSDEFDVNTVNITPLPSVDIDWESFVEENRGTAENSIDLLYDIIKRYNQQFSYAVYDREIANTTVLLTLNIQEHLEQVGNDALHSLYGGTVAMAYIMFSIDAGEEGMAIIKDSLLDSEAQEVFDKVVIQVIRDAEEHGITNIYRLLDEVLEMEESNNFVSLKTAVLSGYLLARNMDVHLAKSDEVSKHIESLYARGF